MRGLPEAIDKLISVEFRRDGVHDGVIEPLYAAARRLIGSPLAFTAAERLREVAQTGATVYIATGHVHPVALPMGETDGPPGAAALARSLVGFTAAPVVLLCEPAVVPVLRRTCTAAGLIVRPDPSLLPLPRSVAIVPFPIDPASAFTMAKELAVTAGAVVTIEKVGPSDDGRYRTASGTDVTDSLSKVDYLVTAAHDAGCLTIGIGDLGNEIGMGLIRDTVQEVVSTGRVVGCTVPTDVLVVAGCSNWGAYGVAAGLAALERNVDLLHTAVIERAMITECCLAGGVDGFSCGPTLEVDGASYRTHMAFVRLLRDVVAISIDSRRPARHQLEGVR